MINCRLWSVLLIRQRREASGPQSDERFPSPAPCPVVDMTAILWMPGPLRTSFLFNAPLIAEDPDDALIPLPARSGTNDARQDDQSCKKHMAVGPAEPALELIVTDWAPKAKKTTLAERARSVRQALQVAVTQEQPERPITATVRVQKNVTDMVKPSGSTRQKVATVNLWEETTMTLKDLLSMQAVFSAPTEGDCDW